jgi:hypothetical protein
VARSIYDTRLISDPGQPGLTILRDEKSKAPLLRYNAHGIGGQPYRVERWSPRDGWVLISDQVQAHDLGDLTLAYSLAEDTSWLAMRKVVARLGWL